MLFLGLAQSFFSAVVFAVRQPRHLSNRILSFWFLIFSLFFLGLLIPEGLVAYIKIGFIPFFMLTGPVFYFYVRSLIAVDFKFHRGHLVHVIPFAVLSILRVIYLPGSLSAASFSSEVQNSLTLPLLFILVLSILSYWIATLILLTRHQRNILNFFSDKSEKRSLNWVLLLMLVALISHLLFFSVPLLNQYFPTGQMTNFWLNQFNMAMLGYLLLIFGLMQPIIFEWDPRPAIPNDESNIAEKYHRSGLKEEQMQQYVRQIIHYLDTEKPYLHPEYNLQTMVRDLDIPQQNLSQTINESLGKNFYQLINEYRVREFQRLIKKPDAAQFTLLGLAYEAGFNSKSSFNRIFKEITGQTPSQYQREL